MSKKVFQNSSFSGGLMVQDFTMQSILDVFVIQGLISQEDSDSLKKRFRNNAEIEKVLVNNRIVTRETINKAYSILLKIPYVSLANTKIDNEILNIIPQKVAQKYGAVAFGINGTDLQLAVSKPLELNSNFQNGMENLMANKPYTISLYITGPEDFNEAIKQYRGVGNDLKLKTSSYPVVFLRNQNISKSLMQRLPLDFIKKHRAVIFAQKNENSFYMAAERPDDTEVRRAMEYIQKQNHVSIQLMATAKEDIDFIIEHYADEYIVAKIEEPTEKEKKEPGYKPNPMENKDIARSQTGQSTTEPRAENNQEKDGNDKDKLSFSEIFSSLRYKKSDSPVLTIDNIEDNSRQTPAIRSVENSDTTNAIEKKSLGNQLEEDNDSNSNDEKIDEILSDEIRPEDIVPQAKIEENEPIMIAAAKEEEATSEPNSKNAKKSIDEDMDIGTLIEGDVKNDQEFKKNFIRKIYPKSSSRHYQLCTLST